MFRMKMRGWIDPRRGWPVAGIALALVAVCLVAIGPASASDPAAQNLFELHGNAVNDPAVMGDDWANVLVWPQGPVARATTLPGTSSRARLSTMPSIRRRTTSRHRGR
jgi:hypothetical protein